MTLTSPSRLTHAEITPLAGAVGEPGVIMRSANAVEGAASATAAKTTKDRKELVSIFFTLTADLRPCWQGLARRVNDTCVTASAVLQGGMGGPGSGCAGCAHRRLSIRQRGNFPATLGKLTNA